MFVGLSMALSPCSAAQWLLISLGNGTVGSSVVRSYSRAGNVWEHEEARVVARWGCLTHASQWQGGYRIDGIHLHYTQSPSWPHIELLDFALDPKLEQN